jgi:hypothetical protein
MTVLTSKARSKLRDSTFAVPERRAFPINDKNHARAALALIGNAHSDSEKSRIRAKARAMLGAANGGTACPMCGKMKCACGGTHKMSRGGLRKY